MRKPPLPVRKQPAKADPHKLARAEDVAEDVAAADFCLPKDGKAKCDDGEVCTQDICDAVAGVCKNPPIDGATARS